MGSGSFSGGISSSGGGGGLGAGLFKALRNALTPNNKQKQISKDTLTICNKLANKQDFQQQFNSPLLNHVYKALFTLSFDAFRRKNIEDTLRAAGVGNDEGCIRQWTLNVMNQVPETNGATRSMIRMTLDSFILSALGNDLDTYFHGDANKVAAKLDENIFRKASNNFLGEMINQMVKREMEGTDENGEAMVKKAAHEKALEISNKFSHKFMGKEQTTYENFFDVIRDNPEWFKKAFKS